jgi:uncharacterized protein YdeI (YjbR/CyaY-like superfamily)
MPKPPKATSSKPHPKAATKLAQGADNSTSRARSTATNGSRKDSEPSSRAMKLANASSKGAQTSATKLARAGATKLAESSRRGGAATKLAKSSAAAAEAARSRNATKLAKPGAAADPARTARTVKATKLAKSNALPHSKVSGGGAKATKLAKASAAAAKPARAAKATTPPADDLPILPFETAADWKRWLDRQHKTARGLWLKLARKGSGIASVDRAEAVDGALCYGWIDGQGRSFDEHYYLIKFTPRGARSVWSKINRVKVQTLIEQELMKPAGLAEVERAQRDGRWDAAYDSPRTASVPDDLAVALNAHPRARASFAELNAANRYAILWQLQTAKKAETRARRISRFIDMLELGKTLH